MIFEENIFFMKLSQLLALLEMVVTINTALVTIDTMEVSVVTVVKGIQKVV